jgi:putative oxidoreductase
MAIVERQLLAPPERVPTVDAVGWVLRIAAAGVFFAVGVSKLESDPFWVRLFAQIGLGDWFRYLTGVMQVAGGLLFLIPRMVSAAAVLAGSTMVGAVAVHLFVLDTGIGGAIIPFALLLFLVAVAMRRAD